MKKEELYESLIISPLANDTYKLIENFDYKEVTVPKGYCTNGADIPRILWSVWPPNRSVYLPAVVIHDYLISIGKFDKANDYFEEILKILEVNKVTLFCFNKSVRLYIDYFVK